MVHHLKVVVHFNIFSCCAEKMGTDFTSECFWLKLILHLCVKICINLLKTKWKQVKEGMDYIINNKV